MLEQNSYQAYVDASLVGLSPARLVTALYQGAIDAAVKGRLCFESNDVMGRSRAVNKVVNILTELMLALDHEKGGEISANLKRLYSYMQQRALAAHLHRDPEPLQEVERLLRNMIEAWQKVAESYGQSGDLLEEGELVNDEPLPNAPGVSPYGSYYDENADTVLGRSFSF